MILSREQIEALLESLRPLGARLASTDPETPERNHALDLLEDWFLEHGPRVGSALDTARHLYAGLERLTLDVKIHEQNFEVAAQQHYAEVDRLTAELDTLASLERQANHLAQHHHDRAEKAEAEVERLTGERDGEKQRAELEMEARILADAHLAQAEAEIERLKVESATFKQVARHHAKRAERAEAAVERLRETLLRFYADARSYEEGAEPHPTRHASGVVPIEADDGRRAREALS